MAPLLLYLTVAATSSRRRRSRRRPINSHEHRRASQADFPSGALPPALLARRSVLVDSSVVGAAHLLRRQTLSAARQWRAPLPLARVVRRAVRSYLLHPWSAFQCLVRCPLRVSRVVARSRSTAFSFSLCSCARAYMANSNPQPPASRRLAKTNPLASEHWLGGHKDWGRRGWVCFVVGCDARPAPGAQRCRGDGQQRLHKLIWHWQTSWPSVDAHGRPFARR